MYFATGLCDTQWEGQFEEDRYWRRHSSPHGTCQCLCWHAGLRCTSSRLNPRMEGEIWQVAFKSRPLGNTASLTGPAEGPSLACIQKKRGRKSSAAPSSYHLPSPPLHIPSSIFRVLCKVSTLQLSTFNTSHVCPPACFSNWDWKKKRGEAKRRWHSVTIRITTWWLMLLLSFVAILSPYFPNHTETNQKKIKFNSPSCF